MEIRDNEKVCIFAPLSPKLDKRETGRLVAEINNEDKQIAIDLSFVQDCTIDFIEGLKELALKKRVGIFNIPSDIFALFNFMNIDKSVNLYVSELDFEENTRQIINRKFVLI